MFKKAYSWMSDIKKKELEDVRKAIAKEKDPDAKAKLHLYLQRELSREKNEAKEQKTRSLLKQQRKLESALVEEGKTPFHLKRSDKKKLVLVSQYSEMKGKKNFTDFIEKRLQKTASKQHKKLPARNIKD